MSSRMDADPLPAFDRRASERTLMFVRWVVILFASFELAAYTNEYPPLAMQWAGITLIAYACAAIGVHVWYVRWRSARSMRYLSVVAMVIDAVALLSIVGAHCFDEGSAMFALMYLLPIAGALRFSWRGAIATMSLVGTAFAVMMVGVTYVWPRELDVTDVVVPIAIGFVVAAAAAASTLCNQRERSIVAARWLVERSRVDSLQQQEDLKNTFLSAVSHDLRTPLTSIVGFSITLQDRADELAPEHRVMLDHVAHAADDLDRLLSDLLDLDRLTRGAIVIAPQQIDVGQVVARVCDVVAQRSSRVIETSCCCIEARIDAMSLERIVENLITNAVKYTPQNEPVSVTVASEVDGVLVSVDDHGPGIPEDLRTKIFEPFQRGVGSSTRLPGAGIGLSLVARFSQLHGGRAWVQDRAGGGSSFRVWLPLDGGLTATSASADR